MKTNTSSIQAQKKWTEKLTLDIFRETYPDFPIGDIIHDNKPDFIISNTNKVIGIDITEVYQDSHLGKSSKLKQLESVQDEFENDLINEIKKHTNKGIYLGVEFNKAHPISVSKKDIIIHACLTPCLEYICNNEKGDRRIEHSYYFPDFLPDEINAIDIMLLETNNAYNSKSQGGTVSRLQYKHIEPMLLKHEKAISGYKHCAEYWLLIREGNYYAGSFSPDIEIPIPIKSKFNKVFIVRTSRRETIQLK